MKKLVMLILLIPNLTSASDFKIEIDWQGVKTSFNFISSTEMFKKEGEEFKTYQYEKEVNSLYIQNSSVFFGLIKSSKSSEGQYRYLITVNKIKGGDFILEGEKTLISTDNQEIKDINHANISKKFSVNTDKKCMDKDKSVPDLKICFSPIQ